MLQQATTFLAFYCDTLWKKHLNSFEKMFFKCHKICPLVFSNDRFGHNHFQLGLSIHFWRNLIDKQVRWWKTILLLISKCRQIFPLVEFFYIFSVHSQNSLWELFKTPPIVTKFQISIFFKTGNIRGANKPETCLSN